jgi:UDP-glucose 4-epimerase
MKCLVTGGAGFIGSNLVDKLVELGYDVDVIDDESATAHDQFYYNSKAQYYKYDICDYVNTRHLYDGVDYVFHLAAESRIQPTIENPIGAVKTNTLGTATVLQCSREANVKRVMYSSTSSAYGLGNIPPLREDMPTDCLNPYSVSKVAGEALCKMYYDLFGLETIIFRYFNVYGPRQPMRGQYAPVIGLFLRQKAAGEPLTIVGDGQQKRDFTHVSDVVNANILAATHIYDIKYNWIRPFGEIFNVGTGKNYSVLELAHMISDTVKFIPPRPAEAKESLACNLKISDAFSWRPTVKLEDYIKEQLNG